ncbi:MAG TPA: 1-deoxy-D-xylulose-5-phosphate reductoisomerase [Clostridiales bacterium]|nr:1-deoxy-D-xylulose-5-phosphate reductoisomerase [Clostridiales bacterium]
MTAKRRIAILGSTGSIGTQALDIIDQHPDRFEVTALSAHSQADMLFEQVREYRPKMAALTAGEVAIPDDLQFCDWYFGEDALSTIASTAPCDDVLVSVVGMVGLRSVLAARAAGKRVLLANKEALVAGGQLVMDACVSTTDDPVLIPVDSEHSAIYQVLLASKGNPYERIILTASGGPFLTWTHAQMQTAKLSDALKHPNWDMGQKITIDSATMFNKALEMIEAKWLFDATPNQIEVLVHPQSIIHSMVSFQDGATLAQLGVPDMRAPIAFAMAFPDRITNGTPPLRLEQLAGLSFEAPDLTRFPAIRLAYDCLRAGGAACCVLNAANEVAVDAFVKGIIGFTDIAKVVEQVLQGIGHLSADTLDDVLHADKQARARAQAFIHT